MSSDIINKNKKKPKIQLLLAFWGKLYDDFQQYDTHPLLLSDSHQITSLSNIGLDFL